MRDVSLAALGVLVGIFVISAGTEVVELIVVTLVNGSVVTEPEAYFAVRNRPGVLGAKVVYNTFFALAGGYTAARLARLHADKVVWTLALAQTGFLVYGALGLELGAFTPGWMWLVLIGLSGPSIVVGGRRAAEAGAPA